MRFVETTLAGAMVVELEPATDHRGTFVRTFCADEFREHGLDPHVAQSNLSVTRQAGSLRGLHYQLPPRAESKYVRCLRGRIFDVIVDLRPASPTRLQHVAIELGADDNRALYVPALFAHGFQTLTDDVEVEYQMGASYAPELARGLRYDDPSLGIAWPRAVTDISERDTQWPLLSETADPLA
jgi:dTDP-4-dehydrorhamnose 3,5-epimerase